MRMPRCHRVHTLAIFAILASMLFPVISVSPASAEGEVCPEGLVYLPSEDTCMLEEDVPEGVEVIDQHADDQSDQSGEDLTDETDDVDQQEEDAVDTTEEQPEDAVDEEEATDDMGAEDAIEEDAGDIKNLTLMTYSCPINWNPATRDILESHEMCTEPSVPDMTYNILYEGELVVRVGVRVDTDLAKEGYPLKAGMWTIEEPLLEGLADPFAFCAIYDTTGSIRLTVQEAVPGGKMDFLLAEGEELNCEWFSVAEVPEVAAAPSLGLEVKVFSCPAPAEFKGGLDECTLPLPGPVTFEAIYDNQVMVTGTLSSPEFPYEVDQEALSGEWTIRPILQEGWIDPHLTCTSVSYVGDYIGEITHFPPADGSLGVTVRLNPDQRAQCQIWLFSGDVRESVVVVTRDCPEDYDAATLSPGVRKATCPVLQFQDVSVTVNDAAPVQGESTRNGVAVFPAQPGTWRIQVDTGLGVVGRAVTFVTCDQTFAAFGQVQTVEPTINTDQRSVSIDLDEGDALRCDFFFGPDAAVAAEPGATDAEAAEPVEETEADTADTDPGAEMEGTDANDSDVSVEVGTTDGTGEGEEGSTATAGTSTITVQQWNCPDTFSADAALGDLMTMCDASSANAALTLTDDLVSGEQIPEFGLASWTELEPGDFAVNLSESDGTDEPVVYCSSSSMVNGETINVFPEQIVVIGGAITITLLAESDVYCDWFNEPGH